MTVSRCDHCINCVSYFLDKEKNRYFCADKKTRIEDVPCEFFEQRCDDDIDNHWHTGTPTDEGWYLLKLVDEYGHITYAANYLRKGIKCMEWKYAFFGHVIIKWQSIEDEPEVMMG